MSGNDIENQSNEFRGDIIKPVNPRRQHTDLILENTGFCPICEAEVTFSSASEWLRDHYLCSNCHSLPRERALMEVIQIYFPNWRNLTIHESSPANRGTSVRLSSECKDYIPSQLFEGIQYGALFNGVRCENLEQMTFLNESIDLHVTQDVMEHVFSPSKVWGEVARTLRPGGAHIFTTPLVRKTDASVLRARLSESGEIIYLFPPVYHGNPINEKGSLVTVDWGFDICKHIFDSSGLFTHVVYIDDLGRGIRAEYIEVLVTFKPIVGSQDDEIT